jgi:hypothetical protein
MVNHVCFTLISKEKTQYLSFQKAMMRQLISLCLQATMLVVCVLHWRAQAATQASWTRTMLTQQVPQLV